MVLDEATEAEVTAGEAAVVCWYPQSAATKVLAHSDLPAEV